jgi:serine/threonine-protein kinase
MATSRLDRAARAANNRPENETAVSAETGLLFNIRVSTGRIIASKYCLLFELGRGGMGSVWAAEHLTLRSKVAVKLIDPGLAKSADAVRRFEREARAAAMLRSPHVVQVLDFGVDAGSPYLVMELLQGESLGTRLGRGGRLSLRETSLVMNQLARAVTRAHADGFVHRDLKPDNIFLVDEDNEFFVKVLDFGIAKALRRAPTLSDGYPTAAGVFIGTPHHMSPEQAEGRSVDARSDLWSMGIVAFECITGSLPFQGDSLPALLRSICYDPIVVPSSVASVPLGFDAWFARAVARDRDERFQDAREFVEALEPILAMPPDHAGDALEEPTRLHLRSEPMKFDTFPSEPPERRGDVRVPSSIPAGINRKRDLRHTALIHNASRTGALLATRQSCEPNQQLLLTLHLKSADEGEDVSARVIRVTPLNSSIWRFKVGVQFDTPLSEVTLREIEEREARRRR